MKKAKHKIIFVTGLHRSGTTLLANLIARHSQASSFSCTGVNMNEGQYLQTVIRSSSGKVLDSVGSLGLRPANRLTEKSSIATPDNSAKIWSEWSRHWDLEKTFLIEKSPSHTVKVRLLHYFFPDASFVLITRDPVAQAMAIRKWVPNRSIFQALANWAISHEIFYRDSRKIRHHVVSYEGLCADPAGMLDGVFDHVHAPREDVVDRAVRSSNSDYLSAWRRHPRSELQLRAACLLFSRCYRRWGYNPIECIYHGGAKSP